MKLIAPILFFALFIAGCSPKIASTVQTAQVHTTSDSVRVEEHYISVPVYVPGDTTRVVIPVDCDSLGRVKAAQLSAQGHRSGLSVIVTPSSRGGFVSVEADCHALTDSVKVKETTIHELRSRYDSLATHRVDTIRVKYIPAAYKWALALWIILIIAAVGYGAIKLYLKFKP